MVSYGFPMVSYGFPMVFLWFSYGFLWFSYGFPMVFLWESHLSLGQTAGVSWFPWRQKKLACSERDLWEAERDPGEDESPGGVVDLLTNSLPWKDPPCY